MNARGCCYLNFQVHLLGKVQTPRRCVFVFPLAATLIMRRFNLFCKQWLLEVQSTQLSHTKVFRGMVSCC